MLSDEDKCFYESTSNDLYLLVVVANENLQMIGISDFVVESDMEVIKND